MGGVEGEVAAEVEQKPENILPNFTSKIQKISSYNDEDLSRYLKENIHSTGAKF